MLPAKAQLRHFLAQIISDKERQGHVTAGLLDELAKLPERYDALDAFAHRLATLPLRPDWPYVEPNKLDDVWDECDPNRPLKSLKTFKPADISERAGFAFLSSVCGCILGKPLEVNPTLAQIRQAAEKVGEWPLRDYVSEAMLVALRRRHGDAVDTTRETIRYVAADDDINYTLLGMLMIEKYGIQFTQNQLQHLWIANLPVGWCWGPERSINIKAGLRLLGKDSRPDPFEEWGSVWNPGDELDGALIRADAYGYACAGNPALAAELAWRDASLTHRRTGIYGTMFAAAAIATAFAVEDPLEIFVIANQFVPRKSRFHAVVEDSIQRVRAAGNWIEGYEAVHNQYKEYDQGRIYQEIGTVINTLQFAKDVGHGICMQVSQGNDTDSFGCTAGSILGAFFGPGHLEARWYKPFNDTIHTTLAEFHEQKLSEVIRRMGALPGRVTAELAGEKQ